MEPDTKPGSLASGGGEGSFDVAPDPYIPLSAPGCLNQSPSFIKGISPPLTMGILGAIIGL